MNFSFRLSSIILVAASFVGSAAGQVDPCEPGGAKYGTKTCPTNETSHSSFPAKAAGAAHPAPSETASRKPSTQDRSAKTTGKASSPAKSAPRKSKPGESSTEKSAPKKSAPAKPAPEKPEPPARDR